MADLNAFQIRCKETEGHLLITACPGSGKTTVLTFRAEHLLQKYSEGNILGVTFSSDAANELKGRIVKKVPHAKKRVHAATFHALCILQLKRSGIHPDILDEGEYQVIIQNALDKIADAPDSGVVFNTFNHVQSSLNPDDHPALHKDKVLKHVWKEYQAIKRNTGKMAFSDIMLEVVRGMRSGTIKPFNCRWMLADESQDMDEIQHAWVKCHAENGTEVTLVGDDDQCIFGFRAAEGYDGMEGFKHALNANSEVLPINYRCGSVILEAAAKLISKNNPNRIDKPIQAGVKYKGILHPALVIPPSEEEGVGTSEGENIRIVSDIIMHNFKNQGDDNYSADWAVLSRGNQQLNELERHLMEQNISYSRKDGSFWEQPPIKSYLAVINYLVKNRWFGFALFVYNFLNSDLVFDRRVKSLTSLFQLAKDEELKEKVRTLIFYEREWQDMLLNGSKEKEDEFLKDVADFVCNNLPSPSAETKARQAKIIQIACKILVDTKAKDIGQRIFVRTNRNKDKDDSSASAREKARNEGVLHVSLLTMHSSKGLEFDNVWLAGCQSSVFTEPKKDGSMADIPEERRLFYVAMTRAKHHLHSSLVGDSSNPDAIFLQEAGVHIKAEGGYGDDND